MQIPGMTLMLRRALGRRTSTAVLAVLATLLTVAAAPVQANGNKLITSVNFTPGDANTNGYQQASTVITYQVQHCGAGTIYLVAGIRPNNMSLDSRYWYKGKLRRIPDNMLVVQAEQMYLSGKVSYGADSATFGGLVPTADKASCWFDGIGLPDAPKGVKGDDFARTFAVFFGTSRTVLRNPAFEKYQDELDAAERQAEADRKKKEEDEKRQKAAAERQQQEEAASQKAEAERKQKEDAAQQAARQGNGRGASPAGNSNGGGASVAGGAGMGGGGSGGSGGGADDLRRPLPPCTTPPQVVRSGNRYFRKDCHGRLQEVNQDEYNVQQQAQAAQRKIEQQQARERAAAEALQQHQARQRAHEEKMARVTADINTRVGGLERSFAAVARSDEARANIRDLTRLQASYESLEELESDYRSRLDQLGNEFDNLRAAGRDNVDAAVDTMFGSEDRGYGDVAGTFGKMMSDSSVNKQAAAARAELRQQRAQMEQEIIARRKAQQLALRKELFNTFKDAGPPLSSQRVDADTLYFFSYGYSPDRVNDENPSLTLTNVFTVSRRGDGGWPFKRSLNEDLVKVLPGQVAWAGFYTTSADADQQRRAFLDYARKGGFSVREVEYQGRGGAPGARAGASSTAAADASQQFWNSGGNNGGTAAGSSSQRPAQGAGQGSGGDAFWGKPAGKGGATPAATNSFW